MVQLVVLGLQKLKAGSSLVPTLQVANARDEKGKIARIKQAAVSDMLLHIFDCSLLVLRMMFPKPVDSQVFVLVQ
jgi:hypothetical protein